MFKPRRIESHSDWTDADGIKIYTVSAQDLVVDRSFYSSRLSELKRAKAIDWANVPAFAILHDGASAAYLVLAWWGNDNELFTSVSVRTGSDWIEDPSRFSFCVWDLEILWQERNFFIRYIYCEKPDFDAYRTSRFNPGA